MLSFSLLLTHVFLPNLHGLERPEVVAAQVAHDVDVELHRGESEKERKATTAETVSMRLDFQARFSLAVGNAVALLLS